VCAEVEAQLRGQALGEDVELVYLNAALRDDFSYNAMASREEKLDAFDRFLESVRSRYAPDFLYIACNTLSILFDDPRFRRHDQVPTQGIVETGTRSILAALDASGPSPIVVFATPTTVSEGAYPSALVEAGVPAEQIVQQACPGLPDAISNDHTGGEAQALLERFVPAALAGFRTAPRKLIAFLGCTHYGYQAERFRALLADHCARPRIVDPNTAAAGDILQWLGGRPGTGRLSVRFVSPYRVPEKPLASLPRYLGDRAPATVAALRGFEHDPRLYG